jgi:hypothetical protein
VLLLLQDSPRMALCGQLPLLGRPQRLLLHPCYQYLLLLLLLVLLLLQDPPRMALCGQLPLMGWPWRLRWRTAEVLSRTVVA